MLYRCADQMASLEDLKSKAEDLRRRSREVDRQCRQLSRQSAEPLGPPSATPWVRSAALRVFALSGDDTAVALDYLRWKGRRADEAEFRMWCSGITQGEWQSLLTPEPGQQKASRQLRDARKFLDERAVVSWAVTQNKVKRIAPTPGAVLDVGAALIGPQGRRSTRYKWLRRVVARWGGRKAVFQSSEVLQPDVLEHKATSKPLSATCCTFLSFGHSSAAHILGPQSGPPFWARVFTFAGRGQK